MHIYHYASYERTHLTSIAARHGVGEADVDQLLADGVLVDLYPIVKRAVRVGSRSYSIKKLEPLYMGDRAARGRRQVGRRLDPRVRARPRAARDRRRPGGRGAGAGIVLDDLADYNEYDCVSTLRLRDWLLGLAREAGVAARARARCSPSAEPARSTRPPRSRRAAAARRAARRPDARRRPHGARARGRGDRLPRPRAEELLVGALLPRRAAARGVGGPPRRARRRPRARVPQGWYREDQQRIDRRGAAARRIAPGRGQARAPTCSCSTTARPFAAEGRRPRLARDSPCGARGARRRLLVVETLRRRRDLVRAADRARARHSAARRPAEARRSPSGRRSRGAGTPVGWPRIPRSTCCGASRRARARGAARRCADHDYVGAVVCSRDSTTPTSPCRARPAPARPTSPRT